MAQGLDIMDGTTVEYFRQRERIEREAANSATCNTARLAHEQLAEEYAALVRDARKISHANLSGLWSNDGSSVEDTTVDKRQRSGRS
jgi:hypothetical protein